MHRFGMHPGTMWSGTLVSEYYLARAEARNIMAPITSRFSG